MKRNILKTVIAMMAMCTILVGPMGTMEVRAAPCPYCGDEGCPSGANCPFASPNVPSNFHVLNDEEINQLFSEQPTQEQLYEQKSAEWYNDLVASNCVLINVGSQKSVLKITGTSEGTFMEIYSEGEKVFSYKISDEINGKLVSFTTKFTNDDANIRTGINNPINMPTGSSTNLFNILEFTIKTSEGTMITLANPFLADANQLAIQLTIFFEQLQLKIEEIATENSNTIHKYYLEHQITKSEYESLQSKLITERDFLMKQSFFVTQILKKMRSQSSQDLFMQNLFKQASSDVAIDNSNLGVFTTAIPKAMPE